MNRPIITPCSELSDSCIICGRKLGDYNDLCNKCVDRLSKGKEGK